MLFRLPTFNATLNPCPVNPATAFTAHEQGQFCGSCQRVVQDFSRSENPVADLAAARAASPDGRVCGSFRRDQAVALPTPPLSRRLRWFLLALVLVVGQGLTAREALAQVRKPVPKHHLPPKKPAKKQPEYVEAIDADIVIMGTPEISETTDLEPLAKTGDEVYTYAEQMPQLPSGGGGIAAVVAYIQQQIKWPPLATDAVGRVFVSFIVGKDGLVRDAKIVKGLHPLLDAETLRVVQALPVFTPGRQAGQPVAVSLTLPVTFKIE